MATNRLQYIALKASGMCVRCGVAPAGDERVHCKACAKYHAQISAQHWKKKKTECDDRCSACRRNKPSPGMKTCASCRIMTAAAARKRAEKAAAVKESQGGAP